MRRWRWLMLLWGLLSLGGCGVDTGVPLEVVVERGNAYMEALKRRDLETAFAFYDEKFFNVMPEEGWREYLEDLERKLGPMQSFSLMYKSKDTRFSGIFYILQYKTTYARGEAREVVTFIEPVEGRELKIYAHKVFIKRLREAPAEGEDATAAQTPSS